MAGSHVLFYREERVGRKDKEVTQMRDTPIGVGYDMDRLINVSVSGSFVAPVPVHMGSYTIILILLSRFYRIRIRTMESGSRDDLLLRAPDS